MVSVCDIEQLKLGRQVAQARGLLAQACDAPLGVDADEDAVDELKRVVVDGDVTTEVTSGRLDGGHRGLPGWQRDGGRAAPGGSSLFLYHACQPPLLELPR